MAAAKALDEEHVIYDPSALEHEGNDFLNAASI